MHNFRELKVWQKARQLVRQVYITTKEFPKEELFALTIQMRRSAISIASNIAEGCGRSSDKQLAYFLDISKGSASELECQLLLSFDLGYIDNESLQELFRNLEEIQRMVQGFKKSLTTNN
jgi:four helix bundle protein